MHYYIEGEGKDTKVARNRYKLRIGLEITDDFRYSR